MVRAKLYAVTIMLSLVTLLSGACTSEPYDGKPSTAPTPLLPDIVKPLTEEESLKIAEEFVKNSPTFAFDGIEDSIKSVGGFGPDPCSAGHSFRFKFDSRHPGYGDRTGQALAQVITHHIAEIYISFDGGEVTFAIMDGKWDMLNQKMF
jgi:hypothetical protein